MNTAAALKTDYNNGYNSRIKDRQLKLMKTEAEWKTHCKIDEDDIIKDRQMKTAAVQKTHKLTKTAAVPKTDR